MWLTIYDSRLFSTILYQLYLIIIHHENYHLFLLYRNRFHFLWYVKFKFFISFGLIFCKAIFFLNIFSNILYMNTYIEIGLHSTSSMLPAMMRRKLNIYTRNIKIETMKRIFYSTLFFLLIFSFLFGKIKTTFYFLFTWGYLFTCKVKNYKKNFNSYKNLNASFEIIIISVTNSYLT